MPLVMADKERNRRLVARSDSWGLGADGRNGTATKVRGGVKGQDERENMIQSVHQLSRTTTTLMMDGVEKGFLQHVKKRAGGE